MVAAPVGVEVVPGAGRVTYRLGWRQLGWRRWAEAGRALAGTGWAIVWAILMRHWFWGFDAVAGVFALWTILPLLLPSRAEITVDEREVRWREVGWMKGERASVPREEILRLRVDAGQHYRGAAKKWVWVRAGDALLVAELANGAEAPLVLGYPRAVVLQMAEVLREALGQDARAGGSASTEVVDLSGVPLAARDVLHRPLNCDVVLHDSGEVKTFLYARYSKGGMRWRFVTMVLATVVIAGGPLFVLWSLMRLDGRWPPGSSMVIVFEVGWLSLMAFLLRHLWRTMAIVVTPEHLTVAWRGWLGGWERSWARGAVAGIKTQEDSEGKVGLIVVSREGAPKTVVRGEPLTWRWVATEVRRALGVGIG